MDWCEKNNENSNTIIEMYNSFSSLFYILVAYTQNSFIHLKIYISLIGITSFIYHSTLNYYFQIADEFCIVLFIYETIYIYLHKPYWNITRYILIIISGLSLFIYPLLNAVILIILGSLCIIYFNYFELDTDKIELKLAKVKFIIGIIFWIMDKMCIFGIHLHFAWHFYSSLSIYWLIRWIIKYKYKKIYVKEGSLDYVVY
jgi:hypothetical protein